MAENVRWSPRRIRLTVETWQPQRAAIAAPASGGSSANSRTIAATAAGESPPRPERSRAIASWGGAAPRPRLPSAPNAGRPKTAAVGHFDALSTASSQFETLLTDPANPRKIVQFKTETLDLVRRRGNSFIAVRSAGTHSSPGHRAAGRHLPGRVGPFDVGAVTHQASLASIARPAPGCGIGWRSIDEPNLRWLGPSATRPGAARHA